MKNDILSIKCIDKYFSINWALMNSCNYKCHYCHSDLNSGSINFPSYDVVIKFVNKIIEHSKKNGLTPYFEFGGGEVTLLKYFGDLIKYISYNDGLISIISNGSKSLNWWKKNIHYLNGVSLSYHVNDIKNELHFINVLKIIEKSKKTQVHLNVMMDPLRFDDCYSFANKIKNIISCSIALQPLFEGFGHGGITKKYAYTKEQELLMKNFRGKPEIKLLPEPRAFVEVEYLDGSRKIMSTFDLLVNDLVNFIGWDCYAGIESIVITFSGDIYRAWCMQDDIIGTIYQDDFILPNAPTFCHTKICQCGIDISSTKINKNILNLSKNVINVKNID